MNGRSSSDLPLILVVDDSEEMLTLYKRMLTREGYRVVTASGGESALALFAENQPDLIVLDLAMPGIDGIETCARLRLLPDGARLPILMVTALDDELSIEESFKAGASEYITKPVHWAVLRYRIRVLIEFSRARNGIEEMEARMAAVADNVLDGIMTFDEERIVETVNPALEKILGYSAAEITGRPLREFFGEIPIKREKEHFTGETVIRGKHGAETLVEIHVNGFTFCNRRIYAATIHDITSRKRMEQELRAKNDELERMNRLFVGRELRMKELKERINELERL